MSNDIPWVEKYRPTSLNNIVLDEINRKILNNIIKQDNFPNILFFGPPGTGKTTTIINLIREYNENYGLNGTDHIMHLNASDERGVEVIRNQIHSFVNSNSLFGNKIKFVILDEVDYMTKTAQLSLKNILGNYKNVRYCLICNYISKIDKSLQEQFIHFRFNQLPKQEIYTFLKTIINNEKLNISKNKLFSIIDDFDSDIRSMINYIQTNNSIIKNIQFFHSSITVKMFSTIHNVTPKTFFIKLHKLCVTYNMDLKQCIKKICVHMNELTDFIIPTRFILHNLDLDSHILCNYLLSKLKLSAINSSSKK